MNARINPTCWRNTVFSLFMVFVWTLPLCTRADLATSFQGSTLDTNLFLDVPNPSVGTITLLTDTHKLHFSGPGADVWNNRNGLPYAWTPIPNVGVGGQWQAETEVQFYDTSPYGRIVGLTTYSGPDGSGGSNMGQQFTFGLDHWDSPNGVWVQGLGNNHPGDSANLISALNADIVDLRMVVTVGAQNYNTYDFYFKLPTDTTWTKLGTIHDVNGNDRVALFFKGGPIPLNVTFMNVTFNYFNVTTLASYTYTNNSDNTITITGYSGYGGNLTIPSQINGLPVSAIGSQAFAGCGSLTNVTIPGSVTSIGDYAFSNCTQLASIFFMGDAPALGSDVFDSDPATAYYLSDTTGWGSTYGLLPTTVWSEYAYTTNSDNTITITGYTGPVGDVSIPSAINGFPVTSIGSSAFSSFAGLTSVTIPNDVTNIGASAFLNCASLTNVTIGTNVTAIGDNAFNGCGLTSVTVPNSVVSIGEFVFANCGSLSCAMIPGAFNGTLDGTVFNNDGNLSDTYYYTPSPDGVSCAITGYSGTDYSPVIPSTIDGLIVTDIGDNAFYGDGYLGNLTIPNSVTTIGNSAFNSCYSLGSVTIPNSVTSIGDNAFNSCYSLGSVTIPTSVTTIGNNAFDSCYNLGSVILPVSVYSNLDSSVFSGESPTYAFWYASGADFYVYMPNGDGISCTITGYSGTNTSLSLPGMINGLAVTYIGASAFFGNVSLAYVVISSNVTAIGDYAFYGCSGLTSVTLPGSLTSIGNYSFFNCSALTSITMPGNVVSLGSEAFGYCFNLATFFFQGAPPADDGTEFDSDPATIYYLAGTSGWGSTLGGIPTVLWNPQIVSDATFGVQASQFGFTITGTPDLMVVVQACTNLTNPVWVPVATTTLSSGTSYFNDPQWTNYPARFYRLASPW